VSAPILITGTKGKIGSVLVKTLGREIRAFDLPEFDVRSYEQLKEQMAGCNAVIHLAWDTKTDNWDTGYTDPAHYGMIQNVLKAAEATGTKRVILASSIHADMPKIEPGGERSPYRLPEPDSPYGASKVAGEILGRYFAARKGLEVICIRFGWVDSGIDASVAWPIGEGWIRHDDCLALINACLDTPTFEDNYAIVYGLSRREGGVHDLRNPFGWEPKYSYSLKTPSSPD
jgi:NAD+ dependent glucose-6-phosphate dehydrogenase